MALLSLILETEAFYCLGEVGTTITKRPIRKKKCIDTDLCKSR